MINTNLVIVLLRNIFDLEIAYSSKIYPKY